MATDHGEQSGAKRLWRPAAPIDTAFAEARLRSPAVRKGTARCARCGAGAVYEIPRPLVVEWDSGSDSIGDFVLVGRRVIAKRTVAARLSAEFRGVSPSPVEMIQEARFEKPGARKRAKGDRVLLPYEGPPLVELWPTADIEPLPSTTFEVLPPCSGCGSERRTITGVEVREQHYDLKKKALVPSFTARAPGQGVFLRASDIDGLGLFRVAGSGLSVILCDDAFRASVQEQGYSNIEFLEYGNAVDE